MAGRDLSAELFGDTLPAGGRDLSADLGFNLPAAPQSSRTDRLVKGLRDPLDGGAQLMTNMLPDGVVKAGNRINNWLADNTGLVGRLPDGGVDQQVRDAEKQYQANRAASGETGFDGYRVLGNVVNPANLALAAKLPAAATMLGRIGVGAAGGALTGAFNPVTEGDFIEGKAQQIGVGALAGGVVPALTGGLARIISPNASTNPNLQLLKSEGIQPTIGQTLGGRFNAMEEKLSSLPIMGDMIANSRTNALGQFNNAAINRASGQVGVSVEGSGQRAVKQAGDALSNAYDDAISQVKYLKFDQQFATDVGQLKTLAQGLTGPMRSKFNTKLDEVVGGRLSGTGSMLGATYKKVDSEIGGLAAKFQKSSVASESELGDAFAQLQNLLKQQAGRSNPVAADALKAADTGWANLVRVEGASKAAQNAEGLFTPAQLNMAIRQADQSTRGRSVSRGTALLQDLGNAGQQVLGNKVPNSGTADRLMLGGLGLGSGLVNPAIPAGLLGGAALYTSPMQSLLRSMVSSRGQAAQPIADAFRQIAPGFIPGGAQVGLGLLN
jgi:hypothetical protein